MRNDNDLMAKTTDGRIAKLTFTRMDLADLKPHPRNPRRHPEPGTPEWAALKASLDHDYFDPLVWNKRNGMLVSGHLRLKVMKESGFTAADVVTVDYDEETHFARMMSANRQQGTDNNLLLTQLLTDMEKKGVSFMLAGFTRDGVDELLARAKEEADKTFLNQHLQGGSTGGGDNGPAAPKDGENFPFVVVFDAGQHAKIMEIVRRAKEHFGTDDLQTTVLRIFDSFETATLNKKGKK